MKKKNLKFYFELFCVFVLLGFQMIGNFGAFLPILEKVLVEKKAWIKKEDILDSLTWGRCGPGAAVVNAMVYLGNKISGAVAGCVVVIAFCIAPFCIIIIISYFINDIFNNVFISHIMKGVSVGVVVKMMEANVKLFKKCLKTKETIFVFLVCTFMMFTTKIPAVLFIIVSCVIGIVIANLRKSKNNINKLKDYNI